MDYLKDIEIDENVLDVECLNQPKLAMKYGSELNRCKDRLIRAEENIKVVRSELIELANNQPDEYLGKGVKPTGPNIEAYYRASEEHKEAKEEWLEALSACNDAEIAYKEIGVTRKKMLEHLIELHGQNYFSTPNLPHSNLTQDKLKQAEEKQLHARMGKKLKKKNESI